MKCQLSFREKDPDLLQDILVIDVARVILNRRLDGEVQNMSLHEFQRLNILLADFLRKSGFYKHAVWGCILHLPNILAP